MTAHREAPTVDPWMQAMRTGEWEEAWRISDEILQRRAGQPCWHWPRHLQYIWDGTPVEGARVLVRCYHGLGDTLQYARFLALLKERASRVILWAQPVLVPLLQTVRGVDEIHSLHDGAPEVEHDVDVEIMELAHVFRPTLETLPRDVPYVFPPTLPAREPLLAGDLGQGTERGLQVGVVWRSGDWDSRRSVPLAAIERWAKIPGLTLHALQRGPALAEWSARIGVDSGSNEPVVTAQVMKALDLVITVDSMTAHLAGALGVPTWTLLHADPDWRWMLGRSDSPWYPTMRLFRQSSPGDWDSVVSRVGMELSRMAADTAARERSSPGTN